MPETDNFLIPAPSSGIHRTELVIKRSRFIASVAHTAGTDEVKRFLEKIRAEFPDARHHCYAFNAGKASSTAFVGCSDDGEPSGTAGQPMLNVLVHSGIGEITAVVTRYFGGTLLGTGGLVKAYQDSIKEVLKELPVKKFEKQTKFTIAVPVMHVSQAIRIIKMFGGSARDPEFCDDKAKFEGCLKSDLVPAFKNNLTDITKGKIEYSFEE